MLFLADLPALIRREFVLELRTKYGLYGLLLYAFSMVFIIAFSLSGSPDPAIWNIIHWLIILFTGINAVARSFMSEPQGRTWYLYTLAAPAAIILAKILYNTLLLSALSIVSFFSFRFFAPVKIPEPGLVITVTLAGAAALAANLSLISAIAAKARNNATLMAVLSFPVIIPLFVSCIRGTLSGIVGSGWSAVYDELGFCLAFFVIIVVLSFILFPYIWKD